MAVQKVLLLNQTTPVNVVGGLVPKGAYDNGTDYAVGDSVDYNGSSYVMFVNATAGTLPTDTTKWQVLANKGATGATGADGDPGAQGDPGVGVPTGGTTGQILAKNSDTNYDTEWVAPGSGSGIVETIVAGNNIDVDATDPANPIVSVETLTLADISDVTSSASELNILDGATLTTTELNYIDGVTSAIQTQIDGKQPIDSDLTTIAGLSPSNDDVLQRKAGAWTNRTMAQVKTDLALVKGDVGLGNVDNTSDANKPVSTATQTALDLKAPLASPTFTGTVTLPVGLTGVIRADTGVVSVDSDVTDLVSAASAILAGKVELATDAETNTGTDTTRAITPANLTAWTGDTNIATVGTITAGTWNGTDIAVADGGTGRSTSTTAYGLIAAGTTATGAHQTLAAGATTEILVGGGASALPVWTTAQGSGAPVRATSPTLTTPNIGTPSAGVLTNCTGLPAASVVPGTLAAGTYLLAENASIGLDPAGSADGKYSGITVTGLSGYTQAFGDLVTLDKDDSRWEAVDISVAAAATGDARGILGMVVSTGTDGNACTVLLNGIIRADANFPALTIGAAVYASTTGDVVVTQPTTTDHVIRVIGFALTADEIYFNPSNDYITHT